MSDLELEWQSLVDSGECDEDFESWYSSKIDQAMDRLDMER